METLILPAPGKLNLFLHINGQREDGMHELQTIFQLISYSDTLHFTFRKDHEINLIAKIPGISPENNIVMRAARLMQQQNKQRRGVDIVLKKKLPIGAGLGGGSSNAATTLHALNCLWGLNMGQENLRQLAVQLGADVAVFVEGRSCWAEGVGEQLTPMTLEEQWYLVVTPPLSISTAEIFFDKQLTRDTPKQKMSSSLIETGNNDCQAVVVQRYPIVAKALHWLNQFSTAQMTGTGASIFARFDEKTLAEDALAQLPLGWRAFVARGINRSPLLTALEATG